MAAQTVTTVVNYDDASISGLLNGETITINGGSVTVNSDVRWNQQAAVFGNLTLSSTLGGSLSIDGRDVWEVPFSASTGNVPTQNALGSNGVSGGTSGATGELLRVWATGSLDPATAGGAMPATGWIKLRSKTGTFQTGETITLPGGTTITASGAGKRSWIHVVGSETGTVTIPRLGNFSIDGDWYEIGVTDGTDNQQLQFPIGDECVAVQVETAPASGVYEWWSHGAMRWINNAAGETQSATGATATLNNISGPPGAMAGGQYSNGTRLRETATNAFHGTGSVFGGTQIASGTLTYRAFVKKETRRWVLVQAVSGANRFGALVDLDAGTIIANPTVGSPTGTSSAITAIGDGWYQVDLTLAHLVANTGFINVMLSNSATPTYDANGFPIYLGATTEGVYYSELLILHPTLQQIATDARGNYFFSDATTGTLTFAKRDANYNAGLKPPAGCRVRIPNVILSNATAGDWNRNTLTSTISNRYDLTTSGGGVINIRYVTSNWYVAGTNPGAVTLENSAFSQQLSVSNVGGAFTVTNCAVGSSRSNSVIALNIATCYSGATFTDCLFVRNGGSGGNTLSMSACEDFVFTNCRMDAFPSLMAGTSRGNYFNCLINPAADITFTNCTAVGAGFSLTSANNITITNLKYADQMVGVNAALAQYSIVAATCNGLFIDGFSAFANIANVHPYAGIISTNTFCNNIELRNVGTPAAPYDGGTINPMGLITALIGTTTNMKIRRVYVQNTRTGAISTTNTSQNLSLFNVWGDVADTQAMVANSALAQGCRWTNAATTQTAVYGTHWEDAFISTTDGRLIIVANEPIAATANQCVSTFGANAGFTATGTVALPNLSDTITWTMPYFALGHTGIAKFTSGVFTNPWFVTGTNVQFLEFEYQIDTGNGFSAWKHLLNQGRRSAGGTSGTNTVTLVTAERTAMLRQPQIGDFVQTGSNRLPHNTTITNVAGDVLTLSNNFASSVGANEPILIWRDIANETIDSATGYKLKVRVKVNTANSTNSMSFLRIPFDTTSVAQQTQYPLPTTLNVAQINNLVSGSRVQVYNVTTATEIANEIVAGTTWSLEYNEGTNFTQGDVIRVRITKQSGTTAYLPFLNLALAGSGGWTVLASQDVDTVYNGIGVDGATATEFAPDYPNVQVDISDANGQTSVDRLYSWFVHTTTTESGIRNWFGGIVAEDAANFRVVTATLNLKLDNVSATGVEFTGGHRLYRDDNATPLVSSTTGGGSITLFAGKVYTSVVSTSSPVITGDISQVPAAVQSGMIAQGYSSARAVGLDRLDAAVSTRLSGSSYIAPPTAASNAAAVRAELSAELARVDAPISTRLSGSSYSEPPTAEDTAAAVLSAAAAAPIPADIRKVNNYPVQGQGTEANPWGPV